MVDPTGSPACPYDTPCSIRGGKQYIQELKDLRAKASEQELKLSAKEKEIVDLRTEMGSLKLKLATLEAENVHQQKAAAEKAAEIIRLRESITSKDEVLNDLRRSQAMWSSLFMAKEGIDSFQISVW